MTTDSQLYADKVETTRVALERVLYSIHRNSISVHVVPDDYREPKKWTANASSYYRPGQGDTPLDALKDLARELRQPLTERYAELADRVALLDSIAPLPTPDVAAFVHRDGHALNVWKLPGSERFIAVEEGKEAVGSGGSIELAIADFMANFPE